MKKNNRLIHETSPYLLQHAHNPVDWYPWGEEALNKAKSADKPILVSIGYAACHWCHVMEKENFEDEQTAAMMNENFINIKIDREERPDLDHIYMDAVQVLTGSGGWPLNVFLTPDAKPFYGGTYFPPIRAHNRPSWKEVLLAVADAFKNRRSEIDSQAEGLTQHLQKSNAFGLKEGQPEDFLSESDIEEAVGSLLKTADKQWGGFGKAPKFPQTFSITFLIRNAYFRQVNQKDANNENEGLKQALLSLDKMIAGGLCDQVGGGFARYSTDSEWLVPHFEKMLYDNALLVSAITEASQLTKKEHYQKAIEETIAFVQRELMHPSGGFYSALDADSEGVEGKYYVWNKAEVTELLGENAPVFCDYFDITDEGNWEHRNILWIKKPAAGFSKERGISEEALQEIIAIGKRKLLANRQLRPRPLTDDKVILGWNALMNTAISKAYAATGKEEYKKLAVSNMNFLLENFSNNADGSFWHTWKDDVAKIPAFLDDYAFLIEALIQLHDVTSETKWLVKAKEITDFVMGRFADNTNQSSLFHYTVDYQQDVLVRKTEVYDGALPSGNSVMAQNLLKLSFYFNIPEWGKKSREMFRHLSQLILKYPSSFGNWACLWLELYYGSHEIAIVGPDYSKLVQEISAEYIPNKVIMGAETGEKDFPLLAGKSSGSNASAFLCSNYTCFSPVNTPEGLISLIHSNKKG